MKSTYVTLLFAVLVLVAKSAYAQVNLVLNPSFEIVDQARLLCNFYQNTQTFDLAISNWSTPTRGTSDIYHMSLDTRCVLHPMSVSNSNLGNRLPRTGQSMIGLLLYSPNSKREYIQGELSEPLQAGHRYTIRFYVSLASKSRFASNNFGVKFFNESFFQDSNDWIDLVPDVNNAEVVTQRFGWVEVVFHYTPTTDGARYFSIGNFFNDDQTQLQEDVHAANQELRAYYYIDDVTIVDRTPTFDALAPLCRGAEFQLPTRSKEGYTGKWSPEENNQQTTTYVFTPDDIAADATTLTVEIIQPYINPAFSVVERSCEGEEISLPERSENGYLGHWVLEESNSEIAKYTFIPEEGHCVLSKTIEIEIVKKVEPRFDLPAVICFGSSFELPIVSTNGIEGQWSPAIDLTQTTTYTFTPLKEFCALPITHTVEVLHHKVPRLEYYCLKSELYVEVVKSSFAAGYSFEWSINQHSVPENSPRLMVSKYRNLLQEGENVIELTTWDEKGCSATTTLVIQDARSLCFIPKGISPQGDQRNDYFNIENFGGVYLEVFNRYGKRVYHKGNYKKEWSGQSDGG